MAFDFKKEYKEFYMPKNKPEIVARMDRGHAENSAPIYKHYALNELEKKLYPYFKRIVDLFQYPDVCEMVEWLKSEVRREKCAALIRALVENPL